MRVILDGQPLLGPLAGVGHYTRQLVQAMARADARHRYSLLVPRPVRFWKDRPVPSVSFAESNVDTFVPGWWTTMRARVQRRLARDVDLSGGGDRRWDVFHGTNTVFPCRLRADRHVLAIHDLTLLLFPEWHPADRLRIMTPGLEPSVRRADHVITPSESTRHDVLKLLPVEPERVSVIPDGIDPIFTPRPPEDVRARLAPFGVRMGEYLLFLGSVEPRKNLLRILEALEMSPPDVGPLVVAGGQGWNNAAIRAALARLERAGRVRLLGYVADDLRPALITGARAFVYPSLYEGFGLPPLEAMACGTPVLASNVSSLPEVVGEAALSVDPEDVSALAEALARLWGDDGLRADLRARGLAHARGFTWERTARGTLDVYHAVLGTTAA